MCWFVRLKTNVFFTIVIFIAIWKSNFKYYYNLKRSWFGVSFTLRIISLMVVMRSSSNIFTLEKKQIWGDVCVRKIIKHRWQVKIEKSQTPSGKISIVLWLGQASSENDWNLTLGCLRFLDPDLSPVLDSISPNYMFF